MSHTPAPWNNRTAGDPTDKNGGQIYAGKKNIATAHYGADIDTTTATANARLIAAAPTLLNACQSAQSTIYAAILDLRQDGRSFIADNLETRLAEIDAAIAIATA